MTAATQPTRRRQRRGPFTAFLCRMTMGLDGPSRWAVAIVGAAVIAWCLSILFMADMDHGPGTSLHSFPGFVAGWVLMLTAMMLPSELSYVRSFSALTAQKAPSRKRWVGGILVFVSGYLLAWIGYGVVAFVVDGLIRVSPLAPLLAWYQFGPAFAGGVLVIAGLYQLSSTKQACLHHCRTPLSYFAEYWRAGILGTLFMGMRHGMICVACCWALMAVMFAVGAMSLPWMAILTLIMFAEKVFVLGRTYDFAVAAGLAGAGVWIALSPDTAPFVKNPVFYNVTMCRFPE